MTSLSAPERKSDPHPTPADEVVRLRVSRKTLLAVASVVLTTATGGGAWMLSDGLPIAKGVSTDPAIEKLESKIEKLEADAEAAEEKRLADIETRLTATEARSIKVEIILSRLAEESLGLDEARRLNRAAIRAAKQAVSAGAVAPLGDE